MRPDSEDFGWDLNRLRSAQARGELVFVLGAGINKEYGLPLWRDLLTQLLIESRRLPRLRLRGHEASASATREEADAIVDSVEQLSLDPLLQAAMVRSAYVSDEAWLAALGRLLTPAPGAKSPADEQLPLRVIARMLVNAAERPDSRVSVLTFNYDSLLEEAINAEIGTRTLCKPRSIATETDFFEFRGKPGFYIHHLHGFVGAASADPILDAKSYLGVLDDQHWSRHCLEDTLLTRRATALFLGLSLADPNLRFVLSRWSAKRESLSGFYVGPPPVPPRASTLTYFRQLAFLSRTILDLYDDMLNDLQLVVYHLSSWRELTEILTSIEDRR